jgi:hypothetical protein
MNRLPPLQHPLTALFQRATQSLTSFLNQDALRFYYGTIRNLLNLLGVQYPQAAPPAIASRSARPDWFTSLRSHQPPLATITYTIHLFHLPRPLTVDQDQIIQQELLRRDERNSNAFLLLGHTGMRIGECADLSFDCLRLVGPDSWAIHVPLGKLKTEGLVPVDSFVSWGIASASCAPRILSPPMAFS